MSDDPKARIKKISDIWPWHYLCDCGVERGYLEWKNCVWYASKHVYIKHRLPHEEARLPGMCR